MLEKTLQLTMMYDYYGQLLTEKQQKVMELYFFHDLSLGEIAEQQDISRQGVYDHLHRAEEVLQEYEEKLGLVARNKKVRNELDDFAREIENSSAVSEIRERVLSYIARLKGMI